MTRDEAATAVLAIIDLPYIATVTHDEKDWRTKTIKTTIYAQVLRGATAAVENWCHTITKDNPGPWHSTAEGAAACFDKNHPGLREALELLEAT